MNNETNKIFDFSGKVIFLELILIALKLFDHIPLSWVVVLLPVILLVFGWLILCVAVIGFTEGRKLNKEKEESDE